MQIDRLTLDNIFLLAPLAGYTDLAFRTLCRRHGAALCYTEMISCHGLVYGQDKTRQMLATIAAERPVGIQLFGADPELMGRAAAMTAELSFDLIDINMGCPVRKVVKKGAGAALMRDPVLAEKIIRRVRRQAAPLPVSVKIRSGWNRESLNTADFAGMIESAGAGAITVHGRTAVQGFTGRADWQVVREVRDAVNIPVIGNGDINSRDEGLARIRETGCDAVMIGRAALGNPWVFEPAGRPAGPVPRLKVLAEHLDLIDRYLPAERMLARTKNHAGRYFKGVRGGSTIRRQIYETRSFRELRQLVDGLLQDM